MTDDELAAKIAHLGTIHEKEIGARAGEYRAVLLELQEARAEAGRWKVLADLKDAKGEANRTENNRLRAELSTLRAQLEQATSLHRRL